jgi:hypothetical protein
MLIAVLSVVAGALLAPPVPEKVNPTPKEQIEESMKRLKELRQQRIATLKETADQMEALYKNARESVDALIDAKQLLLQAELEGAEKESDRIALYQKYVQTMGEYEALAESKRQAARGTLAAVLKVKARRLEAEIRLEEAKLKVAKQSK